MESVICVTARTTPETTPSARSIMHTPSFAQLFLTPVLAVAKLYFCFTIMGVDHDTMPAAGIAQEYLITNDIYDISSKKSRYILSRG
jgi:hypothetical protein